MSPEGMPRTTIQSVETEKYQEKLSSDYQNIRDEALKIIDLKIAIIKDELGPNAPEIARYEAAKDKIANDQYIIGLANVNNWQKLRDDAEDLDEKDKSLAQGIVDSALNLH